MCCFWNPKTKNKNVRTRNKLRYFNKCCWVRIKYYRTKEQNLLKTRFGVWVWFGLGCSNLLPQKRQRGYLYVRACVFFLYFVVVDCCLVRFGVLQCFYRPDRSVQPRIEFGFESVQPGNYCWIRVGWIFRTGFNWGKFDSIKYQSNSV